MAKLTAAEIAKLLRAMGGRLQLAGANPHRAKAYARAADNLGLTTLPLDRLLAEGHEVDAIDDLSSGSLANLSEARTDRARRFTFHRMDIRSPATSDYVIQRRPEVVFHLAGQSDPRVSMPRQASSTT